MMRTLAAQPARRTPPLPPVDSATRSSIRVAVVDDERTLRESCHSVLQAEGYNVALCGRGNEARAVLLETYQLWEMPAAYWLMPSPMLGACSPLLLYWAENPLCRIAAIAKR